MIEEEASSTSIQRLPLKISGASPAPHREGPSRLPAGWEKDNFRFILHYIIGNITFPRFAGEPSRFAGEPSRFAGEPPEKDQ